MPYSTAGSTWQEAREPCYTVCMGVVILGLRGLWLPLLSRTGVFRTPFLCNSLNHIIQPWLAPIRRVLRKVALGNRYRLVALDMRGHGETQTNDDLELSSGTLSEVVIYTASIQTADAFAPMLV